MEKWLSNTKREAIVENKAIHREVVFSNVEERAALFGETKKQKRDKEVREREVLEREADKVRRRQKVTEIVSELEKIVQNKRSQISEKEINSAVDNIEKNFATGLEKLQRGGGRITDKCMIENLTVSKKVVPENKIINEK